MGVVGESIGVLWLRWHGDVEFRDAICISINVTVCMVLEGGDLCVGAWSMALDTEAAEIEECI